MNVFCILNLVYKLLFNGHGFNFKGVVLWHHVTTMTLFKEIFAYRAKYLSTLVFLVQFLVYCFPTVNASVDCFARTVSFRRHKSVNIKTLMTSKIDCKRRIQSMLRRTLHVLFGSYDTHYCICVFPYDRNLCCIAYKSSFCLGKPTYW